MNWLDEIRFDENGLIPAIAQDAISGKILMMAWMNRESLRLTAEKKEAVYWSRSRGKLWHKGEESGNVQKVKSLYVDCDADAVLVVVEQVDVVALGLAEEVLRPRRLGNQRDQAEPLQAMVQGQQAHQKPGADEGKCQ